MNYSKINNLVGWICFLIATATYVLTLEPSASFWDCGEFISSAFKMQIVHQPGAPLFLMIERLFSILAFGDVTKIAYWMNFGSAVASGATILFLFWTITALAKKALLKQGEEMSKTNLITIMGAGAVGALAYTFSDSFWFSAVETEVYALSSLFTAIVFWAILKWDAVADRPRADRWLLFIAYTMGLSIGIHLLNLLTIPAIALVYYFRKTKKPTSVGVLKALGIGILILAFIQYGIIQYMIKIGAYFDLFFVNTLGLPFNSGVLCFTLMVIAALTWGILYSIKKRKAILNLALLSTALVIFGYGSFAMIFIRAQAKPNLNNSDPDNPFSFLSYLNREQYGDRPLIFGPNYNSIPKYKDDGSAPIYKETGKMYRKGEKKYEVSGTKTERVYGQNENFPDSIKQYQHTVFFPRMYSNDNPDHIKYYKEMTGLDDAKFPTFFDNLSFFFRYQMGLMYTRYFMWNFVGRQNDEQGQGSYYEGRSLSGIKPIDALNLGDQSRLPPSIKESAAYNRFFFLPLLLGILGGLWHLFRKPEDAGIVGLLFFFTGIAIVLYLNQKPLEPRERDYAYVGSFYAFAIWIGFGVLAIKERLSRKINPKNAAIVATGLSLLCAPALMACQGWDDHDRSTKTMTRDIAINYLQSCAPNAILFTYGDNDTYPLWYVQEVENIRPDIRLVNLSLFDTDWYIDGMRKKANQSAPLPITMKPAQYVSGVRDLMYYNDYKLHGPVELQQIVDILLSDDKDDQVELSDGSYANFIPTKNFKLTVNPQDVESTQTLSPGQMANIAPALEWKYNKNYVTKGGLAMFDILVHNNWKRPVYFSSTVPNEQFNGLDNYLFNEGLALRLLPMKTDTAGGEREDRNINLQPMYEHVMNKFKWGNIKNARYLDPQSADDVSIFNNIFNTLTSGLIKAGRLDDAKKVMAKYDEVMPSKIYGIRNTMSVPEMADNLYTLGQTAKANALIKKYAEYIRKEITYLGDVTRSKKQLVGDRNIQISLFYALPRMSKTAEKHRQKALAKELADELKNLFESGGFEVYMGKLPPDFINQL